MKTSLGTLTRVLDAVNWQTISKGNPDAWLYFYEDFLEVYDNDLRKLTGSYYTPPEVVGAMVRLVDDVLRSRFQQPSGLASAAVTVADPAVGTGTFLLGVLGRIAATVEADEGAGAVPDAIDAAIKRLIAFEMQLGPFAVAQLRIYAELLHLIGRAAEIAAADVRHRHARQPVHRTGMAAGDVRTHRRIPASKPARSSCKEPITVVIGNPPYKEKAKGRGGWIEDENSASGGRLPRSTPGCRRATGASARTRSIFATSTSTSGDGRHGRCSITTPRPTRASSASSPSPVSSTARAFRKCGIISAAPPTRSGSSIAPRRASARSQHAHLPGRSTARLHRAGVAIREVRPRHAGHGSVPLACPRARAKRSSPLWASSPLTVDAWTDCATDWRAPFLPASTGAWATYPALEDLFAYNGSGVMPGRTWVIAPMPILCGGAGEALIKAKAERKEALFVPHLRNGKLGDKQRQACSEEGDCPVTSDNPKPIAEERGDCLPPIRYGFRSFDRQWIIPDNRVINQPQPGVVASTLGERRFT